jgi:hypothetical protein
VFKGFFLLPDFSYKQKCSYQNFENNETYGEFIVSIVQRLEPISYYPGQIIHQELQSIDIVTFVTNGSYDIGYEINKMMSFKIRRFEGSIIGMFEVTFHRRSNYVYRANKGFEGFFIRKRNWHAIGHEFPEHYDFITKRAFMNQVTCLSRKMQQLREVEVKHYE